MLDQHSTHAPGVHSPTTSHLRTLYGRREQGNQAILKALQGGQAVEIGPVDAPLLPPLPGHLGLSQLTTHAHDTAAFLDVMSGHRPVFVCCGVRLSFTIPGGRPR